MAFFFFLLIIKFLGLISWKDWLHIMLYVWFWSRIHAHWTLLARRVCVCGHGV